MRFAGAGLRQVCLRSAIVYALACGTAATAATPDDERLRSYAQQAGTPADVARGQAFFTTGHGREWRCDSCHGTPPTQAGRHAATGKPIRPLAPAFEATRFTDAAKVETWFHRNCGDVVGRDCTSGEKADVIACAACHARAEQGEFSEHTVRIPR